MTSSTRIRFGALAAAAAVVAGGFFAAAPAQAADEATISLANTTFTAGDWGSGLDVTGTGFTADSDVTIFVAQSIGGDLTSVQTTADGSGEFEISYKPTVELPLPASGEFLYVTAISDEGDSSNQVKLTVLAPKGIATSVSKITTADLANKEVGFELTAGGYTPGETVTVSATMNGEALQGTFDEIAGPDGAIAVQIYMGGVVESGTLTITAVGKTSGLSQSVSLKVIGETVVTEGTQTPTIGGGATAAASTSRSLPVVSG